MRASLRISTVSALAIASLVGLRVSAASWLSPANPEPGGNIAPFLTTSATSQVKRGGLTVQGQTVISDPATLTVGSTGGISRICWGGVDAAHCRNDWSDISGLTGYLHLQPPAPAPADSGYVNLTGPGTNYAQATLAGTAGAPTATRSTYGIYGRASGSDGGSAAITAQATADGQHYALYADASGASSSWAGFFDGNVAVSDASGLGTYDLAIGGGAAFSNNVGEICLGSVGAPSERCRSSWPTVSGSGYWKTVSADVQPKTSTRSIAIGGAGSPAPFNSAVTSAGGNPIRADLAVAGTGQFDRYVVGTPTAGTPFGTTCGDGICLPPENSAYGSPDYCPKDCDHVQPGNVTWAEVTIPFCERRRGHPEDCPPNPSYTLYVVWLNPADTDLVGARLVIRNDRYPTGPQDACQGAVCGGDFVGSPNQQTSYLTPCDNRTNYFVGAYAYDLAGNYAAGSYQLGLCTNAAEVKF